MNLGAWYNTAVSTLSNAGIIKGYDDGTFRPNAQISRAEFAAMACRFFEATGALPGSPFQDVYGNSWYYSYVMQAYMNGIVKGYDDGSFRPNNPITRAEACAIVNRLLDRHPVVEGMLNNMTFWPDNMNVNAWYFKDMQEATNTHDYIMYTNSNGEKYEIWQAILANPDWATLEKTWVNIYH